MSKRKNALRDTMGDKIFYVINGFFLLLLALIIIYPLYFIIIASISDPDAVLGGEVSSSRIGVDSGWIEKDRQVGQTGKTVHPDLYIACGISGAIQHLAGMESSECIIAINTDENCPMMKIADLGIVGDLKVIIPKLTEAIKAYRAEQRID